MTEQPHKGRHGLGLGDLAAFLALIGASILLLLPATESRGQSATWIWIVGGTVLVLACSVFAVHFRRAQRQSRDQDSRTP